MSFLDSLGPRARRRAEPRASIAIAGAGCALAVLGVLTVAADTGSSDGDFNRVPGIILSALVVGAGFFTLSAVRTGAMATAGAVAAALGVPPLMFFLTFDENGWPPYSSTGILLVSTLAWLFSYAVGPGRGRPFFLGAGLIGLWFTILQVTEDLFDAPFLFLGFLGAGFAEMGDSDFDSGFGEPTFSAPDPATLGILSLGLGVGYLLLCRWLDTRGHRGAGTPFALATLPTLFTGVAFLGDDLEQAGSGLLLLLVGAGLAAHGATLGRRATAWVGGGATALGAAIFLGDMTDDATVGGLLFLAAGIGLVAAGHAVASALREPDEMAVTVPLPAAVTAGPAAVPAADDPATPPPPPPVPADAPPPPPADDSEWAPPPDDPPPPS